MLRVYTIILITFLQNSLNAQQVFTSDLAYKATVLKADAYYNAKKYLQSALVYDTLFQETKAQGYTSDKYNAACSWALAGRKDKAFQYLKEISTTNEIKALKLVSDSDLVTLRTDKRWVVLLKAFRLTEDNAERKLGKKLINVLDTVFKTDQELRVRLHEMRLSFDTTKKDQIDSVSKQLEHYDSVNLTKVKSIIDKHGWLGYDEIGDQGNLTLFLVIQHADLATQVAYIPKMKAAFEKGKARGAHLALLEDRVLVQQGRKQVYGSQVRLSSIADKYEFYPIENEKQVNLRRKAMDLEPLEEYAKRFKIDYVVPAK